MGALAHEIARDTSAACHGREANVRTSGPDGRRIISNHIQRDSVLACSNSTPTYIETIHVTCTRTGARVGSVGGLAGADYAGELLYALGRSSLACANLLVAG